MKPELLMPAGNMEKLEYAVRYGADAVYLGMVDFSLRTMRKGDIITAQNLKDAIDLAHKLGSKAYLTLNIFAFDDDIKNLNKNIDVIKNANPDAVIISDFGIYNTIKNLGFDIHVSTQTNTLNSEAVKFWRDLGAKRVILARELSFKQIEQIRKNVPDIELECFVHGSQCVSFSGRCLLSDYMTKNERKANHGGCAQPCRWSYKLVEQTRPDEFFEINQNEKGTHILSPKDLCLVHEIARFKEIGVDSLKVEGRTKSTYYVSAVAKAYRAAIDGTKDADFLFNELKKVGNRGYTKGFLYGDNNSESYSYNISKGLAGSDFLGIFIDKKESLFKIKAKNKIKLNDEAEVITPNEQFLTKIERITDDFDVEYDCANTNDELWFKLSSSPENDKYALIRTKEIKNPDVS